MLLMVPGHHRNHQKVGDLAIEEQLFIVIHDDSLYFSVQVDPPSRFGPLSGTQHHRSSCRCYPEFSYFDDVQRGL